MAYATRQTSPRTLDDGEQALLLKVTGAHARGYRDHVLFSAALGTALRQAELLGLNMGDVYTAAGRPRRRFPLSVFKRSNKDVDMQEAILPDNLIHKLQRYREWKRLRGESLEPAAPLFLSRQAQIPWSGGARRRLSARMYREAFKRWQKRAGFTRFFNVHALRHTALSNLYRDTKDLRLVQRVARHKSVTTTQIYTHPTDEDVLRAVRGMRC